MNKLGANLLLGLGGLLAFKSKRGSRAEIIPFPKWHRPSDGFINPLSVTTLPPEEKRVAREMMAKGYRFIIMMKGGPEEGHSTWELYAKTLDHAVKVIGDYGVPPEVHELYDPGDNPSLQGTIPFPSGSRSLEDVVFLAQTRGGKHYHKIYRILSPDPDEELRRRQALMQIIAGERLSRGQAAISPDSSEQKLRKEYFQLFGKDWASGEDYEYDSPGSGMSGDFEWLRYQTMKKVFEESIRGRTYYVLIKDKGFFDPIEETGFSMKGRDAVLGIQEIYRDRNWRQAQGKMDGYRFQAALHNLTQLGFPEFNDILAAAQQHTVPLQEGKRIKEDMAKANMAIDDETLKIVHYIEELWKKAWTVEARKSARKKARAKK